MSRSLLAIIFATAFFGASAAAHAEAPPALDCAAQAAEKKLAGAVKNSFMKKCEGAAALAAPAAGASASGCAEKAVGKNGKPLYGAAKNNFMKKCAADAAAKTK